MGVYWLLDGVLHREVRRLPAPGTDVPEELLVELEEMSREAPPESPPESQVEPKVADLLAARPPSSGRPLRRREAPQMPPPVLLESPPDDWYAPGGVLLPGNSEVVAVAAQRPGGLIPEEQREVNPAVAVASQIPAQDHTALRRDLGLVSVQKLMSTPVDTVQASASLEQVEFRGHHLPVVGEKGELVGMLSDRDLLSCQGSRVEEAMSPRVLTATLDTELRDACEAMVSRRFHSLVVIDSERRPAGILTSYDVLTYLAEHPATSLWRVD